MTSWYNADGLLVTGGRDRVRETGQAHEPKSFGVEHSIIINFDLEGAARTEYTTDRNNDGTKDGFNTGDAFIPDQAHIVSATAYMSDEAAAGGTALIVGTYQENGTAIDADGLITAINGADANLGANVDLTGTGALVGTAVTQKSYVGWSTTGTHTAGKGMIVIKYVKLQEAV